MVVCWLHLHGHLRRHFFSSRLHPSLRFHFRSRWGYVRVESAWRWLCTCVLPGVDVFSSGLGALFIVLLTSALVSLVWSVSLVVPVV